MDIRNLVTFKEVARTLNFSRSAETLNYAQSTITAQIRSLEMEIGAPLFDRFGKNVMLTEVGERLLIYAEKLINLETEARFAVSTAMEEPTGTLIVDASESILFYELPRIIRTFREQYPLVELIISPRHHADYVDLVEFARTGKVDVALEFATYLETDIHYEQVANAPLGLYASPDYPLARQSEVTSQDLNGEVVFFTVPDCPYRQLFDDVLNRFNSSVAPNFESTNLHEIKKYVMLGRGITLLPDFSVAPEVERGDLVKLNWVESALECPIMMVRNEDRWLSPAEEAFCQLVREMLLQPQFAQ